jgi:hypothetical protein
MEFGVHRRRGGVVVSRKQVAESNELRMRRNRCTLICTCDTKLFGSCLNERNYI